jgi:2,4-dienoyl-CoA reductase-like NADH-dependent reductase (Old Yellow Enzyme family)
MECVKLLRKLSYKSLRELKDDIERHGYDLGVSDNIKILAEPVNLGGKTAPNALAAHPMEGGDSDERGAPTELTFRKYERVSAGGIGLVWLEAVSVCQEGRSNPGQLYITEETLSGFKELARRIYAKAVPGARPVTILQLNHSGRYSKPDGVSAPIIAGRKTELDERLKLPADYPLVSDDYMDALTEKFVKAAVLAKEAGFDGVDIKACHGYLLHDFFSCFDRAGKYGGSFENRTRLLLDIIDKVREAVNDPDFIIASRINLYDALPVSRGWGTDPGDFSKIDLSEPVKLAEELVARGTFLINVTMGNPYFAPHINRPYDLGAYMPEEPPLEGTYRLIYNTAELQKRVPEAKIVGVGYSWLREFSPYVAAWALETGGASLIGYGRQFIAYPDFAKDIIETGRMQKNKVCVACSKCAALKRDKGLCGCVVRDSAAYLQLYMDTYKNQKEEGT